MTTALALAVSAAELAVGDPVHARQLAAQAQAENPGSAEVAVVCERARGLAAIAQGDLAASVVHLRRGVRRAERGWLPQRAAEVRTTLAFALAELGRTRLALVELDRARPALTGLAAAKWSVQQATVLLRLGRVEEAVEAYQLALVVIRRERQELLEGQLRLNRAVVQATRGAWRAAEDDLVAAERIMSRAGRPHEVAIARHDRAYLAALRGNLPAALAHFDAAESAYAAAGSHPGLLATQRAEVLLSLGLVDEGRAAAQTAVASYQDQGQIADLAEARLVLAHAALLGGDVAAATDQADQARRAFRRQHRPAWEALARYVLLRAAWAQGTRSESMLRTGRRTAADLAAAGWMAQSADARLLVARTALELGHPVAARRELAAVGGRRRHGPADLRARAWHGEALLRCAAGDQRGAIRALQSGLRVLDRLRATLGATELRAAVSYHGEDLAKSGLAIALASRQPAAVLCWSERWRAGALRARPAHPPADANLTGLLAQLRQVVAAADAALRAEQDPRPLLRRQAALELAVARAARHAGRDPREPPTGLASAAALAPALGPRALIEYVGFEGRLHAVTMVGARLRLHDLGPLEVVQRELDALRFAQRRLARAGCSAPVAAALTGAIRHAANVLDGLVLAPLGELDRDQELVVVPTGALHALAWSVLPTAADRPITVAPSAALWLRAAEAPAAPAARTVLAVGPGLPAAVAEVAALAARYPGATTLTGDSATAAAVLAAADGAGLVHLAAHGRFRADNALFSCLEMADGPLLVHDFERLTTAPYLLLLSACDSGLSEVRAGNELMGLAAVLLALGTRTIIASVAPVPDGGTELFMVALHARLQAGVPPAAALAGARRDVSGDDPCSPAALAAASFGCLGAG